MVVIDTLSMERLAVLRHKRCDKYDFCDLDACILFLFIYKIAKDDLGTCVRWILLVLVYYEVHVFAVEVVDVFIYL